MQDMAEAHFVHLREFTDPQGSHYLNFSGFPEYAPRRDKEGELGGSLGCWCVVIFHSPALPATR